MKLILTLALTAAIATSASATFAGGHDGNPAVTARQSHMTLYQHNVNILGNMMRGNTEYDAGTAQAAANNLVSLSTMAQVGYWVPGTSNAELGDETRLLPTAFEAGSTAGTIAGELATTAAALAEVAGNGLEAMGPAFGAAGATCTACHKAYRASRN